MDKIVHKHTHQLLSLFPKMLGIGLPKQAQRFQPLGLIQDLPLAMHDKAGLLRDDDIKPNCDYNTST